MPTAISKTFLEQKLNTANTFLKTATEKEKQDALWEEVYWLGEALEKENPKNVLLLAFSLWERTHGKAGLQPFELPAEEAKKETSNLTLWGMLDSAFQTGELLDDKHVSDIFNGLPPAAQTHFIDTVANYIHASVPKTTYAVSDIAPILKDEKLLLNLVEKTKVTAASKEEHIKKLAEKLIDWLRYHTLESSTEEKREEVLYGIEAARAFMETSQEKHSQEHLPPYELLTRDRLRMSTEEYMRMRDVTVEKLLHAVPEDSKHLALITQSAVRQDLLAVPDAEFQKRVRAAALVRSYASGEKLYPISIRQFFRSIVQE